MSKTAAIAIGVFLAFLVAVPFLVNPYIMQIFILSITYSMLALAVASALKVGLPRLDAVGWWAIGAYTTALLMKKAGMSFWLTILIGALIAVILGWLIFSVVIRRGVVAFLVYGLAMAIVVQQLLGSLRFFGGWGGTGIVPQPTIGSFTFNNKMELYFLGLSFLVINVLVYYALYNSKIGRAWTAIGSSLKLARSVGVDLFRYRMANALIGNFFLALAGSYYTSFSMNAVPYVFSLDASVYVMMYVLVGGISYSLSGPITGAFVLTFMTEYFRIAQQYALIISALAALLIIILLPKGFLSLVARWTDPRLVRIGRLARLRGNEKKTQVRSL